MKNKLDIFKKAQDLLDEPEVQELLDYCERLEDELVDFKFEKENNKQLIMLDMLKEVIKGCNAIEKEQWNTSDLDLKHPIIKPQLPI